MYKPGTLYAKPFFISNLPSPAFVRAGVGIGRRENAVESIKLARIYGNCTSFPSLLFSVFLFLIDAIMELIDGFPPVDSDLEHHRCRMRFSSHLTAFNSSLPPTFINLFRTLNSSRYTARWTSLPCTEGRSSRFAASTDSRHVRV